MVNDQSLQNKAALITGGTRGIGRVAALALAARGAHVIILGRSQQAGEATVAAIQASNGRATFLAVDLSLMSEIRRIAEVIVRTQPRLDILIHCADVLAMRRQETSEGLEVSFATNYLSRFLFNNLLRDLLVASAPARILHVAAAGFPGKLDLAHVPPGPRESSFSGHNTGQRANDVFALEFAARLAGTGVTINVINPGMVDTDIRRNAPDGRWLMRVMEFVFKPAVVPPEQFVQHVLHLVAAPETQAVSGQLFGSRGQLLLARPNMRDNNIGQRLWSISAQLSGLDQPLVPGHGARTELPIIQVGER